MKHKSGKKTKRILTRVLAGFLTAALVFGASAMSVSADEYEDARKARMQLPVQTNEVQDWPQGPAIGAEGAILIEAKTGAILYAKNIDEKLYPASTTKIMTGLLAYENSELDEDVTFSYEAVHSVARGDSNIGMDAGEIIPMNKALEGMMILSANEVANAIAEHVGGSMEGFVEMMNKKAEEIGCTNTHFSNPNGLQDENHYTTCRDLALIAKYYFGYEYLAALSREPSCEFVATPTQKDSFKLNTKNMLVKGKKYEYEYLVGSKTGFTSDARQTLVSAAKKDGMELICVIMKEESPYQFEDTVALFNYGFENFKKVNIAEHQEDGNVLSTGFFSVGQDIFGSNRSILTIDPSAYVVLPKNGDFADVEYDLSYNEEGSTNQVAKISYLYHGNPVGVANLTMNAESATLFDELKKEENTETASGGENLTEGGSEGNAENPSGEDSSEEGKKPVTNRNKNGIFINIKVVLIALGGLVLLSVGAVTVIHFIREYQHKKKRKSIMDRNRERRRRNEDDYIE